MTCSLDIPAVHLDGAAHGDLALRMAEDLPDAWIESQDGGSLVEFLQRGAETPSFNTDDRHG
jgi:hypothetical protein